MGKREDEPQRIVLPVAEHVEASRPTERQGSSSTSRAPTVLSAVGLVLAVICFASAARTHTNDGVSAAMQGIFTLIGIAHLVTAPWGFLFSSAASPWTRTTRVVWILWLTAFIPVLCVGVLVALAAVWTALGG